MGRSTQTAAWLATVVLATSCSDAPGQYEHPNLVMTRNGVDTIRSEVGNVPLFDASVEEVRVEVDAEIEHGIDTPIPVVWPPL